MQSFICHFPQQFLDHNCGAKLFKINCMMLTFLGQYLEQKVQHHFRDDLSILCAEVVIKQHHTKCALRLVAKILWVTELQKCLLWREHHSKEFLFYAILYTNEHF